MKVLRKVLALTAAASLVVLILPSTALAGQPTSARGSGHTTTSGGFERVFTFAAVEKNGTVKGQGQVSFPFFEAEIHFAPDCLHVDGNTATMSGVITESNLEDFGDPEVEGGPFWLRVVDNGEGANSPADQITGITFEEPGEDLADCTEEGPFPDLNPVERGNVQVTG